LSEAGLRPTMLFELFVALRASFNFGFVAVCLIGDIPNWFLLRASFPSELSQRRTLFLNYLGAIPILPRLPQRRHSLKVRFMFGDGVRRVRGLYLLEVFSIDDHAPLLNNPKVSNLASLVHTPRKVLLVAVFDCLNSRRLFCGVQYAIIVHVEALREEIVAISDEAIPVQVVADVGALLFVAFFEQLSLRDCGWL